MATYNSLLTVYATQPHPCSYIANEQAITSFIDPSVPPSKSLYSELVQQGFRRSGNLLYRPNCPACKACVSYRIAVSQFKPNRSQKRVWQKNQDLTVTPSPAIFNAEHYLLYQHYQRHRHSGGNMENHTEHEYRSFLFFFGIESCIYEFRLGTQLVAVAVVDVLADGLSAVYTFFEPALSMRSLGVFAILSEIEAAKQKGLNWLYLGYWIKDCQKMAYKSQYQPAEGFWNGAWQPLPDINTRVSR